MLQDVFTINELQNFHFTFEKERAKFWECFRIQRPHNRVWDPFTVVTCGALPIFGLGSCFILQSLTCSILYPILILTFESVP